MQGLAGILIGIAAFILTVVVGVVYLIGRILGK